MGEFLEITGLALAFLDFFGISKLLEKKLDKSVSHVKTKLDEHGIGSQITKSQNKIKYVRRKIDEDNIYSIALKYVYLILAIILTLQVYVAVDSNNIIINILGLMLFWVFMYISIFITVYSINTAIYTTYIVPNIFFFIAYALTYMLWSLFNILNRPKAGIVGTIGFIIAIIGFSLNFDLWQS